MESPRSSGRHPGETPVNTQTRQPGWQCVLDQRSWSDGQFGTGGVRPMQLITDLEISACEAASQRLDRRVATGDVLGIEDVEAELRRATEFLEVTLNADELMR